MLEHFDTIKNSPSHIYHSALPFCPSSSWLHKYYPTDLSLTVKVIKGLPAGWGKCSRTVLLGSAIKTLSCWNNTVAIGSDHRNIIILDIITGSWTAILSGHTHQVDCVTFSSDGTSLVSGSWDCTVKLWDVQTGGIVKTLSGHTRPVLSVSISLDCIRIASGSFDGTIRLWDIQTGECQCVIEQHSVQHVSFFPTNPQHLISICENKLWQWDTNGHQITPPSECSHIAFSSDGTQFISCYGVVVTVKNSDSGATVAKFEVTKGNPYHNLFSLDGGLVAVATGKTIYIWDITSSNPHLVETLIGHTQNIVSLTFSSPSTLISASQDRSVKLWKISTSSVDLVMTDPGPSQITLPLATSTSLQARDGVAISNDINGVVKIWDIPASLCKPLSKSQAEDYKLGDVKLINSRLVLVWYGDKKINIWDPEKGEFLLQADVSEHRLLDLRISGDRSKIFCINEGLIQAWHMWTGEAVGKGESRALRGQKSLVMDGSRVWVQRDFRWYEGWDFGIPGSPPVELSTWPPATLCLNNTRLWNNETCQVRVTGKVVFQLSKGLQGHIVEVQWNGQYLVISLRAEKELILEFPPAFLQ